MVFEVFIVGVYVTETRRNQSYTKVRDGERVRERERESCVHDVTDDTSLLIVYFLYLIIFF